MDNIGYVVTILNARGTTAKRWINTSRPDTIISCTPKVGSSSFRTAKRPLEQYTNEESSQFTNRIGVIRHPIARVQSMYRWLRYQHSRNASLRREIVSDSYETFVNHIFKVDNIHWKEQISILTDIEGNFTPTKVHRFEDVDQFWPLYFDVELPHSNGSRVMYDDLSDYRLDELETRYHRDIELWTISEMKDEGKRL